MERLNNLFKATIKIILLITTLATTRALAQGDDFTGVYKIKQAKGVTVLELSHGANGVVSGTITDAAFRVQLNGQYENDRVIGRAYLVEGNKRFIFAAAKRNDAIVMVLSGVDENWKPDGSEPLKLIFPKDTTADAASGAQESNDSTSSNRAEAERVTYKHPQGFTFASVPGWSVERAPDGRVVMKPGDLDKKESIVLTAQAVASAARADSAEFVSAADQEMSASFPFMARVGRPEVLQSASGNGILLVYQGLSPAGLRSQIRIYAVMVNGNAYGIVAMGPTKVISTRDGELRSVFASIRVDRGSDASADTTASARTEAGASDASPLAQQWINRLSGRKVTYLYSYSSGSGGGSYSEKHWYLAANGTFTFSSESSTSIYAGGANGGSSGTNSGRGSWRIYAAGNQVFLELRFNDGRTAQYGLSVQGGKTYFDRMKVFVE
jgi:hypothetical protein